MTRLTQTESTTRPQRNSLALGFLVLTLSLLTLSPAAAGKDDRITVAVLELDTYMLSSGTWEFRFDPGHLGPLAASMLTTELLNEHKGRFRVVERSYIDQVMKEQDLGQGTRFNSDQAAMMGQLLGAQVVIVGEIKSFGTREDAVGALVNQGLGKWGRGSVDVKKVSAKISARLVDANTGEGLAATEAEGSVSSTSLEGLLGSSGGYGQGEISSEQVSGAASEVMREAIENLAKELAKKASDLDLPPIVPCLDGLVAAVSGEKLYLNVGHLSGVKTDDYFEIKELGEEILDPATGEILDRFETLLGTVQVTQVKEKLSVATVVEGSGFTKGNGASRVPGPDYPDLECRRPPATKSSAQHGSATPSAGAAAEGTVVGVGTLAGDAGGAGSGTGQVDVRTVGAAPTADGSTPVGAWRLDVGETMRYWCRSLYQGMMVGMAASSECDEAAESEDFAPYRQGLMELHMQLEVAKEGTFHLTWKNPADRSLATVDGSWTKEGLFTVLTGAKIDGVEQANAHSERFKLSEGRLFGQAPTANTASAQNPYGGAPFFGGLGWPNLSGAAFARSAQ